MSAHSEAVFESQDLVVQRQPSCGNDSDFWITFNGLEARAPTGGGFIQRDGAGALHVLSLKDDWFQTFDPQPVLDLIIMYKPAGARLILFGSSMGAFAAIAFSGRLQADLVLVGGPQVFVDVDETFDLRWSARWRAIKDLGALRLPDARQGMTERALYLVFYDPWTREDRGHARLLAGMRNVRLFRLPAAGHPVFYHLMDLGLWVAFMQAALAKDFEAIDGLLRVYRRTRKKSYAYVCTLGMILRERGSYLKAATIYERASATRPDLHRAFTHRRDALAMAGDLAGATQAARAAVDAIRGRQDHWQIYLDLVHVLEAQKRYDEIEIVYERAVEELPHHPDAYAALADFREVLNRKPEEALNLWRKACALAPDNGGYRLRLQAADLQDAGREPG